MALKKQIIREKIYKKHYDGLITGFRVSDLPCNLLPTDIVDLQKEEGYYSENNSWDDSSTLIVYREREETDKEFEERKTFWKQKNEESKKARHEQYLKLKKEFE